MAQQVLCSGEYDESLGLQQSRCSEHQMKPGKYRHFKGGEYHVYGMARHSETGEELVVYRPLYGEGGLWVRPLSMFRETVNRDGREVPRFEYVSSKYTPE